MILRWPVPSRRRLVEPALVWCAAAVVCGLLIAALPIGVSVILLAVAAFGLLAAITPLAAVMALVILAPLRTLIATEAPFQLPLDIGQLAFAVLLAAWGISTIATRQSLPRPRWSPLYLPLLIFIAIGSLSGFNALSMSAWLSEWLKWVQILAMVAFVLSAASEGGRWEWLLFGLALAGLANAIIGIYQFFGGSGALHLLINDRFFRAFGTFGQPNPFGGFMGLLIPICAMAALGYAVRAWQRWRAFQPSAFTLAQALFYTAVTGFLTIGIGVSWSRGAWLGLALSLGVVLLVLPRRVWTGLTLVGVFALVGVLLWITGSLPASITARITSATEEYFTISDVRGVDITPENYAVVERLSHWQAALNMARANPWFGVGLGNYEIAYPRYRLINWHEPLGHAHNYYLNILAEAGLWGILGYGKVWVCIMWMNWRARRHPDPFARLMAGGLLGTWIYLFVHSLFDNLYVNNLFLHLGLMLGILGVLYNQASHYIELRMS